jgi:short-subunit dehydrogenase
MSKVWLITGCSTGFGRVLAEELLSSGNKVIVTARKISSIEDLQTKYPDNAFCLELDVSNNAQINYVVLNAIKKFGQIDVLVNNAGYGICGALEEAPENEIRRIFDTNVFGLIEMTKAVLPHMRKNKFGHILNISSVAGLVSTPGFGIYNATKYAVEGLSEALAGEVSSFGIKVTIIEPGPFRTDFAGRSIYMCEEMKEYDQSMQATRNYIQKVNGNQSGDPLRASFLMMRVVEMENPPLRLPLGKMALERIQIKIKSFNEELKRFEEDSLGTDFPLPS